LKVSYVRSFRTRELKLLRVNIRVEIFDPTTTTAWS